MLFGLALSGLQEFVYDLSPESPSRSQRAEHGGRDTYAARRLRIRSATLSLVPAVVAWDIKLSDPNAQIVYLGGGKLLMAASPEAINETEAKLPTLYDWLIRASAGKLGAYWTGFEAADLNAVSVKALLEELGRAKWRAGRFHGWHNAVNQLQSGEPSSSLGDRTWESTEGANIARRNDIVGFNVDQGGWPLGPWKVNPATQEPHIALAGKATADIEVAIPTRAPLDTDGSVAELFKLAEEGEGAPYLALLKLDGDGIGKVMLEALTTGLDEYQRISGKLTEFFGRDLLSRLESDHPRIYLVYSGGDDLVATGHFDAILNFALDLQDRYTQLDLGTVSAGISVYPRNSPILKAVENAEEELQHAKGTRNAVCIGGCRLTWPQLKETTSQANGLVEAIKGEAINRGALNLLRQLGEPWLADAPEALSDKRWHSIPQFTYMRSRRTGWKESEWPAAVKKLFDSLQERDDDWPRAALVGTLAAWRTKTRQEEE